MFVHMLSVASTLQTLQHMVRCAHPLGRALGIVFGAVGVIREELVIALARGSAIRIDKLREHTHAGYLLRCCPGWMFAENGAILTRLQPGDGDTDV